MNTINRIALTSAFFLSVAATNTHAALYDRGNGMIYDSSLNITWLQDANYAKTTGYDSDGAMTWDQDTAWAANLNYDGLTGWRLASARLNGTTTFSTDGSTDLSFNDTRSEIGHLFLELGNKPEYTTSGTFLPPGFFGLTNTVFVDADTNQSVSFLNVQNGMYWEAEENALIPYAAAWSFDTSNGLQNPGESKAGNLFAWAVHDGDIANVSSVPVPAAVWLFGSGLLGLATTARRRK